MLARDAIENRRRRLARATPRGPKIEQHRLALELVQVDAIAVRVAGDDLERKIGSGVPDETRVREQAREDGETEEHAQRDERDDRGVEDFAGIEFSLCHVSPGRRSLALAAPTTSAAIFKGRRRGNRRAR